MALRQIEINGKKLLYSLERKNVKNINIRIKEDEVIYISANKNIPESSINSVIYNKKDFILSALERIKRNRSLNENYNYIKYLGQKYEFEIVKFQKPEIVFDGNKFFVYTNDTNNKENIRIQLKKWYLEQSIPLFSEINNYVRNDFLVHNIRVPETTITVKEMKTRWGSCNPVKAKISMNLKLMEYPKECIYSVFYHEYSHFIHQNHSPEFYKLLLELCPDYKKWDTVLKK